MVCLTSDTLLITSETLLDHLSVNRWTPFDNKIKIQSYCCLLCLCTSWIRKCLFSTNHSNQLGYSFYCVFKWFCEKNIPRLLNCRSFLLFSFNQFEYDALCFKLNLAYMFLHISIGSHMLWLISKRKEIVSSSITCAIIGRKGSDLDSRWHNYIKNLYFYSFTHIEVWIFTKQYLIDFRIIWVLKLLQNVQ